MDTQIRLANENPARQISLTLEPGSKRETSMRVSRWANSLEPVDRGGRQHRQRRHRRMFRGYLRYQQAALWDLDHVLSLQSERRLTEPSVGSVIAGYRIPIYEPE